MAKPDTNSDEAFGSDSFLDIVANMVGILIVLVIIAGLRAKNLPNDLIDAALDVAAEVEGLAHSNLAIENETKRLQSQIESIQGLQASRQVELDQLQTALAERHQAIAAKRQSLDAQSQEEFDLKRQLAATEHRLELTKQEVEALERQPVKRASKIESYPTPLSQTVHGKELHFQLRAGRVAAVPLDELLRELEGDVRHLAGDLRDSGEATDTIGPIKGFRLRFTLERLDIPGRGSVGRLQEFTLIPSSNQLGESLEVALANNSDFRSNLDGHLPGRTTITLWTYPDSFGLYRSLKQNLYLQGFSVAGRPLPEGQPIGGSPQGTKSAAQ